MFGEIPGYPVGSTFESRAEVQSAGLHRKPVDGISYEAATHGAAEAIVLNGGYEDDEDYGDGCIYTGHGGKPQGSVRQIADQVWEKGNAALRRNQVTGLPVRLLRGPKLTRTPRPTGGLYRYDGLYYVEDHWQQRGVSGFSVCRFRLREDPVATGPWSVLAAMPAGETAPATRVTIIQRVVRSTAVAEWVKRHHDCRCQICLQRLETPGGPYAEGAHIRPLGRPHSGPDVPGNILCLCPNCHVRFDSGAISVGDDFLMIGASGHLAVKPGHEIDRAQLAYHRGLRPRE